MRLSYVLAVSLLVSCALASCCNTVTFQPGGSAAGLDAVFADFGQLCNYIASVGNETDKWTIQVDGSLTGGSPSIATGTYALPASVEFVGQPVLQILVIIPHCLAIRLSLVLLHSSCTSRICRLSPLTTFQLFRSLQSIKLCMCT